VNKANNPLSQELAPKKQGNFVNNQSEKEGRKKQQHREKGRKQN